MISIVEELMELSGMDGRSRGFQKNLEQSGRFVTSMNVSSVDERTPGVVSPEDTTLVVD
jgi:hypothetical protein